MESQNIAQYKYKYRFCPMCGTEFESFFMKNSDPARFICRECNFIDYQDPKVVVNSIVQINDRIIFLKGEVEMVASAEVKKIHEVKAMLEMAAEMETSSANDYNHWAIECSNNADSVSKSLFEELVVDEERHFDQYDVEIDNLKKFGDNYLALQSIERSKNRAAGQPMD